MLAYLEAKNAPFLTVRYEPRCLVKGKKIRQRNTALHVLSQAIKVAFLLNKNNCFFSNKKLYFMFFILLE